MNYAHQKWAFPASEVRFSSRTHSARAFQGGGGFTIAKAFTITWAKQRRPTFQGCQLYGWGESSSKLSKIALEGKSDPIFFSTSGVFFWGGKSYHLPGFQDPSGSVC